MAENFSDFHTVSIHTVWKNQNYFREINYFLTSLDSKDGTFTKFFVKKCDREFFVFPHSTVRAAHSVDIEQCSGHFDVTCNQFSLISESQKLPLNGSFWCFKKTKIDFTENLNGLWENTIKRDHDFC